MTGKDKLKAANAMDKSEYLTIRMYREDYETVLKIYNLLRSKFVNSAIEQDISIHCGRCNNLPTQPDALHFLIFHASYGEEDIERSAFSLLKAVA